MPIDIVEAQLDKESVTCSVSQLRLDIHIRKPRLIVTRRVI